MQKLTYNPYLHWSCQTCRISGEIITTTSEDSLAKWERVLRAHFEKSPACKSGNGKGLVISTEQITLPD